MILAVLSRLKRIFMEQKDALALALLALLAILRELDVGDPIRLLIRDN